MGKIHYEDRVFHLGIFPEGPHLDHIVVGKIHYKDRVFHLGIYPEGPHLDHIVS